MVQLPILVATEGHGRQLMVFGEARDPLLEILSFIHLNVGDDDKRLFLLDELSCHAG